MPKYRVTRTKLLHPSEHRHIVGVRAIRLDEGAQPSADLTVAEVLSKMREGGTAFITYHDGHTAMVREYKCDVCGEPTIRTELDASRANSLDLLPPCRD